MTTSDFLSFFNYLLQFAGSDFRTSGNTDKIIGTYCTNSEMCRGNLIKCVNGVCVCVCVCLKNERMYNYVQQKKRCVPII